jgi:cytochrome P450
MLRHPSLKLAPGTFNPFVDGKLPHQRFLLQKSQLYGPIFKFSWERTLSTGIVGFPAAREFLTENDCRISGISQDLSPLGEFTHARNLSGEAHSTCKHHLVQAMPLSGIDERQSALRAFITGELTTFAERCAEQQPTAGDLKDLTRFLASGMLVIVLFGVLPGSSEFQALVDAYIALGPSGFEWTLGPSQVEGYREIEGMTRKLVAGMNEAQLNSAEAGFLREFARADGTDRLIMINLLTMIEMGRYDLASLLRWIFSLLSDNRHIVSRLQEEQRKDADDLHALSEATVFETLRHVQSESLARRADEDIVFRGYFIPRRSYVRICLWETHKDPVTFRDPFHFDPDRFLRNKFDINSYSPFGLGKHRCVAADAVVHLATLFVRELTGGFEWQATGNGDPVLLFSIWEPSPEFTIRLKMQESTAR